MDENLPVYIISSAADLLGIHPRTLYIYEEKGLLVPTRKGNRRFYSANDLEWIHAIRYMIHERGINLEGLRRLLALRALIECQDASQELSRECKDLAGPTSPCWQNHPSQSECYECTVYAGARDGLRKDEEVPRLSL